MMPAARPPEFAPEQRYEPVLERLAACDCEAGSRAEQAIRMALSDVEKSPWPEVAWCTSTLTPGGYPLEFAWSSRDPAIRWTAEVTGPEVPAAERLSVALAVLQRLGRVVELPNELEDSAGSSTRFGAWLGGRHRGATDAYKLYLELGDPQGWTLAHRLLPACVTAAIPRRTAWRMAGCNTGSGIVELYGRVSRQEIWEVERLLTAGGVDGEPLVGLTSNLLDRDMRPQALPGTTGFSLAVDQNGQVLAGGWFAWSRHLLGHDRAAARVISDMIDRRGWSRGVYEALAADIPGGVSQFGLIGAGVEAGGAPWLQIGCRP